MSNSTQAVQSPDWGWKPLPSEKYKAESMNMMHESSRKNYYDPYCHYHHHLLTIVITNYDYKFWS